MMKMRTRNAPDSAASGTVSHKETFIAWYIAYHRRKYGMTVFVSCQSARFVEAFWWTTSTSFKAAGCLRWWPLFRVDMDYGRLSERSQTNSVSVETMAASSGSLASSAALYAW